jgi:hypothetical protein
MRDSTRKSYGITFDIRSATTRESYTRSSHREITELKCDRHVARALSCPVQQGDDMRERFQLAALIFVGALLTFNAAALRFGMF